MAGKRNMTGAQRALLQALLSAHGGAIKWPKKPFRDASLHALQDKKWASWSRELLPSGKYLEIIKITPAGIQAAHDAGILQASEATL